MVKQPQSGFIALVRQQIFLGDQLFLVDSRFAERRRNGPIIDSFLIAAQLRKLAAVQNALDRNRHSSGGVFPFKPKGFRKRRSDLICVYRIARIYRFYKFLNKLCVGHTAPPDDIDASVIALLLR